MSFAGIIRESLKGLMGKELTIFMHIITNCNHADNPNFSFNKKTIYLKRGDWVCSIPILKKLTDYSDQQIRTALKNLEKWKYIKSSVIHSRGLPSRKLTILDVNKYLFQGENLTDALTDGLTDALTDELTDGQCPLALENKGENEHISNNLTDALTDGLTDALTDELTVNNNDTNNNTNNNLINARDEKIEVTEIQKRIDALGHPTDGKRMKDAEYELFDEIENKHDEVRLCEIAQLTHIIAYRILRDYKRLGNNPSLMVYGKFQDLIGAGARPNDLIEVINDFLDWQIEEGQHTTVNSWTYFDSKFNNLIPQQPKKHYLSNNVDAKNWKNKAIDIFKPKKIQDTKRLQKNRTLNELAV